MSLTHEDIAQLTQPFPIAAHEFARGFCYVAEEEVTARIEEVDPSWSFEILSIKRDGISNQQCIVLARMTINGVIRESTGMQMVEYAGAAGNKSERETGEAEKGATTDALRRCARLFGVGRYILKMGDAVKNGGQLDAWLKTHYPAKAKPAAPAAQKPAEKQPEEKKEPDPAPHFSTFPENRQYIVDGAINAGYLGKDQVWGDLLRLADLTDEAVLKFATGPALWTFIKEGAERLKLELAQSQIPPAKAVASLGNGNDRRLPPQPFNPPTRTGSAFARGLDTFQQNQKQAQVDAVNNELDTLFAQTMERNP